MTPEHWQEWGTNQISIKPVPVFVHPQGTEIFPNALSEQCLSHIHLLLPVLCYLHIQKKQSIHLAAFSHDSFPREQICEKESKRVLGTTYWWQHR